MLSEIEHIPDTKLKKCTKEIEALEKLALLIVVYSNGRFGSRRNPRSGEKSKGTLEMSLTSMARIRLISAGIHPDRQAGLGQYLLTTPNNTPAIISRPVDVRCSFAMD